ncbi:NUDIX hydrolase domain-like protein [Clohesyomyces aquaticus]|uniref:NUDIX hydrolase domain-like protein n=1 Tax=Clohesyomyces aquaticus TaxID=1231657 RepID=A0A1Y2AA15_9PLEO|nr:NUDIX hydrolase domain-like protein [Clohesyomyces aquaticus]
MLSQSSVQALARLRAYTPPPTQWYNCPLTRRAAVLILLFPDRYGELKVVLTMRASTLRSYAGQVALPGGKSDSLTETPFDTARREACEEIGLPTTDAKLPAGFKVEHLCELPANLAKTELGVRPCVAFLCPSAPASSSTSPPLISVEEKMIPRLDPKEVAAVFTAPFHNFLRQKWESDGPGPVQKNGKPEKWYRGSWTDWHESRWRMHNFYMPRQDSRLNSRTVKSRPGPSQSGSGAGLLKPEPSGGAEGEGAMDPLGDLTTFRVFGMTARILVDAARVAYGEEPEFEHNSHCGDEDMIGRLLKMGRMSESVKKGEELTNEVLMAASKL